eukprot:4125001-Amphidinium_carterae.1
MRGGDFILLIRALSGTDAGSEAVRCDGEHCRESRFACCPVSDVASALSGLSRTICLEEFLVLVVLPHQCSCVWFSKAAAKPSARRVS